MSKKSSKTAHVLNLLSPKTEEEEFQAGETPTANLDSEQSSPMAKSEKGGYKKHKPDSIEEILHLSENTESLSELIKDNLEKEFIHGTVASSEINAPINSTVIPQTEEQDTLSDSMDQELETAVLEDIHDTTATSSNQEIENSQSSLSSAQTIADETSGTKDSVSSVLPDIEQNCTDKHIAAEETEHFVQTENSKLDDTIKNDIQTNNNLTIDENITLEMASEQIHPDPQPEYNSQGLEPFLPELDISSEPVENLKFYYTNVFERIVKGCVIDYLKRFGVCTCSRCVADTVALALTNLPSKYIVTDYDNVEPLISLYEHKFQVTIITELTKACFEVDGNPHHKL